MLLLILGACDLVDTPRVVAHCDLRDGTDPRDYCQEWRGLLDVPSSDVTPTALCESMGIDYTKTECPEPDDIVGGCYIGDLGDGSSSYWWFYGSQGLTTEDVQMECESGGDEFVEWTEYDPDASDWAP